MADDDGSRRPSQPSTPVNPAGVGASASNRSSPRGMVSPDTIREILNTGNPSLIDDAFEYWDPIDINLYLATIPTPSSARSSQAGVGSTASNRSSPSPAVPRTPTGAVAAGASGDRGGGESSSSSSSGSSRSRRSTPPSGRVATPPSGRKGTPPLPVGASTPRGRPRQGQKEPRGRGRGRSRGGRPPRPNPSPTLPWTPPWGSTQGSPQAPLNQADLQRRLRMLLQDQQQIAAGRRIANITTTNSIVTSYKEGGRPSVQSNSSRFSP